MNIYYSTELVSRKQYNVVKSILKKAIDSKKFYIWPGYWNIYWNGRSKKWKLRDVGELTYCCPLAAVLLNEQPKRITAMAPYDILDKHDKYGSSFFTTLSQFLNVPEDFIHGFIAKFDLNNSVNSNSIISIINEGIPEHFPENFIQNKQNAKMGMSLAKWCKQYIREVSYS